MERSDVTCRFLDFALRASLEMTGEGSAWRDLLNVDSHDIINISEIIRSDVLFLAMP